MARPIAPRRDGAGAGAGAVPLVAIFCLGICLLAIAATIVLALIPVYLPPRNNVQRQTVQSSIQQITFTIPSGTVFLLGPLTQTQLAYLIAQLQIRLNGDPTTVGSVITSPGATVSGSGSGKRKRQTTTGQILTLLYVIQYRLGSGFIQRLRILLRAIQLVSTIQIDFVALFNATAGTGGGSTGSNSNSANPTSIPGYSPILGPCSNGPSVVTADNLYPDEATWLAQRAPNAEKSLRAWLDGLGLNPSDYSASTAVPRLALSTSGGGYRALLTGAGVIQAFDGREQTVKTPFSGLLQGITYQSGTSGGAWLLTSFASNNYPTISTLRDSLWIQRFQFFVAGPNPAQIDYQAVAVAQILGKKAAGFKVTVADVWSRDLAFQLLQAPNGGPNVTFDQITFTNDFKAFNIPLPIVTTIQFDAGICTPPPNATTFEFTPYSFGSWDSGVRAFTPIKNLGTLYNNGQLPANGQCVLGFDNSGFVLGTSSFLFNAVECRILPDGTLTIDPVNSTIGFAGALNTIFKTILSAQETFTTENALSAVYPNPFQGFAQSPKVTAKTELNFVDGGESHQNIPIWPLIQTPRKVELIFANDNSADTSDNFPDGSELMTTYTQAKLVGLPFPFIPASNIFLTQGLNTRPTFFGCNETNVPLVIYLPNTNISYPSGVATFQPTYTPDDTRGLIQNGLNVATRSSSVPWARCVACAIVRLRVGLYSTGVSTECRGCFDQYCFKNT